MSSQQTPVNPWYKEVWVWFILGILGLSVVLGTSMLVIATNNPPGLLSDNYYDVGKGINQSLKREDLAKRLGMRGTLTLHEDTGIAELTLQGISKPQQLELNLISPTQPERDRRVILQPAEGDLYRGLLQDFPQGRRFIEVLGNEGGEQWRLYEEETLTGSQPVQLGY